MGTSTDAIMAYGFNFGSEEDLLLREAAVSDTNKYGYLKLSWFDAEAEEDDDDSDEAESPTALDLFVRRLYDTIPDAGPAEGDYERADVVKDRLGVWFQSYCSAEYPMWVLCTASFRVYRGDAKAVDPQRLADDPTARGWDARLSDALRVLEVTPNQPKPAWLLVSSWG